MKHVISLTLVALLAACGGGGNDAPSPQTAAPAAPPVCNPVKVATFGDSTMDGNAHRDAMQRGVDTRLGAGRAVIENRAVSGTAAFQLLAGMDGRNAVWSQQLVTTRPDVVLINHGINDMAHQRPLAQYRADLVALVTQAQQAGAVVVLQTPVPQTLMPPYGLEWRVTAIRDYAQVMRDVAAEHRTGLAEVSRFVESLPNFEARVFDGVHPDADLVERIYNGPVADALADAARGKCGR